MKNTTIFENPAVHAMKALVLASLDQVDFRHHGIGVLQGYVLENCEPEVRIHIWSRKLLKPGMEESGDIHDHRFDMVSHVLCGSVEHEELLETADPNGDHTMMALTHARAAADTQYHGPTTPIKGLYSVERQRFTIHAGWSYTFKAQQFHHSPLPKDLEHVAVTCVEKWQQREAQARLLYPTAKEPVMAFGHKPDKATIAEVVAAAKKLLME